MDHTLNQDQHFSRLALIFIASNPVIKEEFIQWGAERYKSDLESYFKVLNDYLAGDKSGVMPGPLFIRR